MRKRSKPEPVAVLFFNTHINNTRIKVSEAYGVNGAIHAKLEKAARRPISFLPFGGHLGGEHKEQFVEAAKSARVVIIGDTNFMEHETSPDIRMGEMSIDEVAKEISRQKNVKVFIKGIEGRKEIVKFSAPIITDYLDPRVIKAIRDCQ